MTKLPDDMGPVEVQLSDSVAEAVAEVVPWKPPGLAAGCGEHGLGMQWE